MVLGRRVYNNCMACHQRDGLGVAGNYPPLAGSEWVGGSPAVLSALLLHGLEGVVEVSGETYNQVMPKWSHLTDEQIAAVLTFIRESWSTRPGRSRPSWSRRCARRPWTAHASRPPPSTLSPLTSRCRDRTAEADVDPADDEEGRWPSPPSASADRPSLRSVTWWRVGVGMLIAGNTMMVSFAVSTSEIRPTRGRRRDGRARRARAAQPRPARPAADPQHLGRGARPADHPRRPLPHRRRRRVHGVGDRRDHRSGDIYFEVVTILLVVYVFGQQLTTAVQERALSATRWTPEQTRCTRLDDDGNEDGDLHEIRPGDRVSVIRARWSRSTASSRRARPSSARPR